MKAKEKAKQLFDKFYNVSSDSNFFHMTISEAKQCAFICIDEQINLLNDELIGFNYSIRKIFIDELNEVKKEINNIQIT